uniref:Uncharacterized protein n=1 Tax=Leersia perrieri TaxID=77586 RepID=A0A0D9XN36_9ORYZ
MATASTPTPGSLSRGPTTSLLAMPLTKTRKRLEVVAVVGPSVVGDGGGPGVVGLGVAARARSAAWTDRAHDGGGIGVGGGVGMLGWPRRAGVGRRSRGRSPGGGGHDRLPLSSLPKKDQSSLRYPQNPFPAEPGIQTCKWPRRAASIQLPDLNNPSQDRHHILDCPTPCEYKGGATSKKRKAKPARGFNLRKSITWNPAFFTEQGVLDNTELSMLSGSQVKATRSPASGCSSTFSPLSRFGKSGNTSVLKEDGENSRGKFPAKCVSTENKGRKLFASSIASGQDVQKAPVGSQDKTSARSIQKYKQSMDLKSRFHLRKQLPTNVSAASNLHVQSVTNGSTIKVSASSFPGLLDVNDCSVKQSLSKSIISFSAKSGNTNNQEMTDDTQQLSSIVGCTPNDLNCQSKSDNGEAAVDRLTSTEGPNIDSEMELDTDDESTAKEAPLSHLGSECDHDYRSTECSPMTLAVPSPCVDQEARTANLMENAASSIEKADTAVGRIRSNHSSTEERRPVLSEEQDTEDRIEFDTKLSSSEGVSNIGTNNSVHKSRTNTSSKAHLKNLVPFTEEWLAVMEAFGEEVLEQKSGAVQNSPTDKAAPEPSPWSPVKRKFQDVGPFDCTKYSKIVGAIHHEMVLLVVLLGILLEADPVCGIVGVGEAEPELEGLRGALPLPASVLPGLRGVLAGEHPRGQLHRGDDGGVGDVVGAARLPFTAHGAQHGEDVVDAAGVHVALHQRGVHTRVGRVRLGKQRHRHVLFFFRRVDDDVVQQMRVGHLLIVVVVVIRLCSEQGADVEASVAHGLDDGLCGGDVAEADVGGDEGVEGGVGHGGRRAVGGGSLEVVEDGVEEAERACRWKARDGGSVGAAVGEEVTAAAEHGVGEVGVVGTGGGEGEGVGVQQVEVAAGAEALEKEELE